jgi:hypothetical protein
MNSSTDRAPCGLGKYGTAQIAHHVADFLKATNTQNMAKKAAGQDHAPDQYRSLLKKALSHQRTRRLRQR